MRTYVCIHVRTHACTHTGFRLPNARQLYMYTGCNVYLVEYRGYGNSEGTPSEQGLKLDAVAALNFLHSHTGARHGHTPAYTRIYIYIHLYVNKYKYTHACAYA